MKRVYLEQNLREYTTNNINPNQKELNFVRKIYKSIKFTLGEGNCYRIGSWPRGTAIHPLHDLDILFVAGRNFDINNPPDPSVIISETITKAVSNLEVPNGLYIETEVQSHSGAIVYKDSKGNVQFSVDIVPGYVDYNNPNEQGQDTYFIPDLSYLSRIEKSLYYKDVHDGVKTIGWKKSDPRGYIRPTRELCKGNKDFRLAVKFIKAWKHSAKETNGDNFKLKSFHLEQKLFKYYSEYRSNSIFDGIFFILKEMSVNSPFFTPSILDRTPNNEDPYIDGYLKNLSTQQKQLIQEVRDYTMINLENIKSSSNIQTSLLSGNTYKRPMSEEFLFDSGKQTFTENIRDFKIVATVQAEGNKRSYILEDNNNTVERGRNINFKATYFKPPNSKVLWKVRNDCKQDPRGEITSDKTKHDPEYTKYLGHHYVEAYLISNWKCIEKYRQPVIIEE